MKKSFVSLALLSLALASTAANADNEKKVTEQQVPKAVLDAFHTAYPQATEAKFEKEGKGVYEVEFKDQGTEREASYSAKGKLLSTEEDVQPDALPAAVTDAIKKAYPQATISEAEKNLKLDGTVHCYEVEIKDGAKALEVHLDPTGKILKTEKDDD